MNFPEEVLAVEDPQPFGKRFAEDEPLLLAVKIAAFLHERNKVRRRRRPPSAATAARSSPADRDSGQPVRRDICITAKSVIGSSRSISMSFFSQGTISSAGMTVLSGP